MLKNKSGFVGIGAYAGNQLLPFYKDGYPCLFVNTATTDLDSLTEVDDQYKYQIPGGEGCNKDRIKSRELFRKDIDNIINEVKEKLPGIEYLFVVASLGGGTGAGSVMPMKRVAMNDLDIKACIVITVLPNTKTESIQGECIFIRENLFHKAINFLTMGLYDLMEEKAKADPEAVFKLVELSAYLSLSTATAIGYLHIPWEQILVVEDEKVLSAPKMAEVVRTHPVSYYNDEFVLDFDDPRLERILNKHECTLYEDVANEKGYELIQNRTKEEVQKNGIRINGKFPGKHIKKEKIFQECTVDRKEEQIENILWDGMGLIDESIFPEYADGFVYCRSHFFKSCLFRGNVQEYFKDFCVKNNFDFESYMVKDMFGNKKKLGNVKKKISDLTTGLSKLTEMYNNGLISLDEYNDKSSEYRKEIRSATSDVKDYQDSLVSLYTDALKAEVDALDKVIDKRREAYKQQREYADYQKKVNSQQKDVNSIKAQIQAMENSSDASTLARVKKLKQDLADAEDDLNTTKQDHKDDLIDQGFQKMSDDLNQMLEDTEYEISHNADKQNEIIQSMLNKQVGMYQEAYSKINSIIKNTGWVGSNDFNNNQSQMSSQTGAQNQASNASQSQQTANKKPSSSASGTDTSGIKDNASKNDKITENIMKPENTTNRPVAELKVSSNSVSIEEGKSTSVTATVRPNDAANKTLTWKSSNDSVATVSNGTISGKKPGSCQVIVSTTDGSGLSQTIGVTVTKKPDPPKPAPAPVSSGGDGIARVGDVVTFTGSYYYDSWGKKPAGNLYSGVKNGVVIDSYSSKDFGGNARYTGDLKVHIKSADGRYGDLGWVRLSQISGYAKGTPGVDRDQIAIVDEEGRELQIPNGKGGRITKLEKGTGVIPHTATEKLMALSEQLDNNGNMVINGRTIEEYVNDMANMQSIAVPDFSDVTASVVSQLEGKGMGNVTVENHYDSFLTVNGDVDKDVFPGMQKTVEESYKYMSKRLSRELKLLGVRIKQ